MAKQLNLLATGQVIPTALHAEMQRSYLEYAMSVIVGRALPDVRDGLKPVHRRILYAMHELGLTPDRPYRKCARVVGDVLGKYHPHGDQAVYDALVRLVQEFSTRYPLLAGHGNFGSVDNDPPAAMRYTETRLSPVSHEALLSEIGEATVDFIDNFDSSQQEPTVLPAQLPILLLNGCSGIAVGMATNIPPHNLSEVVDGLIALIDQPDLEDRKLWKLIPGPDFPTGGKIIETSGIRDVYSTGRGSVVVQGITHIEEIEVGRVRKGRRTAIVVTELPYQVNKAAWIEKVAELVNLGRIEGISDLRDESDRTGMRVVIELKRDTQPNHVLHELYKQTALQSNFGAIMLALVDGQPRQLTLRELLQEFLQFREQTLTRQYTYELQQEQKRLHLVEGLLSCLSQLDTAIEVLKNAPDGTTANRSLQNQLHITEVQADAILAMPLRRITGLERQKLQKEFDELTGRIEELQRLLSSRQELLKTLKKDLRSLKRKYADPRRTRIALKTEPAKNQEAPSQNSKLKTQKSETPTQNSKIKTQKSEAPTQNSKQLSLSITEPLIESEESIVEFTYQGYVQRQRATTEKTSKQSIQKGNDFVLQTQVTPTSQELVAITSGGKAYPVKVRDIPPAAGQKQGTPLVNLLPEAVRSETIVAHFFPDDAAKTATLILLTQQGRIKRLSLSELTDLTLRGLTLIKIKEDDCLQYVRFAKTGEQLLLGTSNGRILRFEINDQQIPVMGRITQGNQAVRVSPREQLVGCVTLPQEGNILLVCDRGYGKRIPVNGIRRGNRGDIGTQALQFKTPTDMLVGMVAASSGSEAVMVTSEQRLLRLQLDSVKLWGKDGSGDKLVQLKSEEKIITVTVLDRAEVNQ
ncbi:DNA gyrase/topoisomerase IV subunit A [Limnofasciculus baicalensis]|uniref:DNA topoisomerase (ATP-hydrolyzing) n=1 Tax=Limnofasciculus baicalensis BBK-W-15 TaxID=2699891 RepID=A0AAE3GT39_9CYAN|nr:DNA topoisomerase (ATP-hydrolyzing) [Limnofasciculus baicalensis]MCP2729288.1 DNA topoisomerase 4 subunit A [Limnofasciculus baicalensis BBK-W-15]